MSANSSPLLTVSAYSFLEAGGSQVDRVVAFGREDFWLESSQRRLTSPLGNILFTAVHFLRNDAHFYFIIKGSRR